MVAAVAQRVAIPRKMVALAEAVNPLQLLHQFQAKEILAELVLTTEQTISVAAVAVQAARVEMDLDQVVVTAALVRFGYLHSQLRLRRR
jgi:hypothetical protein